VLINQCIRFKFIQCREERYDKGIVVAATGIGKTYLAAFDSIKDVSKLYELI